MELYRQKSGSDCQDNTFGGSPGGGLFYVRDPKAERWARIGKAVCKVIDSIGPDDGKLGWKWVRIYTRDLQNRGHSIGAKVFMAIVRALEAEQKEKGRKAEGDTGETISV